MEQQLAAQQSGIEQKMLSSSVGDSKRLQELLSPKLPFGLPQGKQTQSGPYAQLKKQFASYGNSQSFIDQKISSPRIS